MVEVEADLFFKGLITLAFLVGMVGGIVIRMYTEGDK